MVRRASRIHPIEDFLFHLDGQGQGEMYDGDEEHDGEYLFFLADASEEVFLDLARQLKALPGVSPETYAIVSTTTRRDGVSVVAST